MLLPKFSLAFLGFLLVVTGFLLGSRWSTFFPDLPVPLAQQLGPSPTPELRYLRYRFESLREYPFQASAIVLQQPIETGEGFTGYQFSFETMGRQMSGQINIPDAALSTNAGALPVIIMNRGWAPQATYVSGTGTRPAARVFARNGYVTIALDFFGYGESAPEAEDAWEARFVKPINVIELLKTIQETQSVTLADSSASETATLQRIRLDPNRIGFWGHSNGGHITISVLEILSEQIPATVWAPVTAPFPYSLLFFTDEDPDEGKGFRRWLAEFEKEYDVFDFSITHHLTGLTGPLQIQHGTADDAALIDWSDAFRDRVDAENARREAIVKAIDEAETATEAAAIRETVQSSALLEPINFSYLRYPGVDHNMQPRWDDAVSADLQFFERYL